MQPTQVAAVSLNMKSIRGILAALIVFVVILLVPAPEGLTQTGKASIGLLLAGIILWTTAALPLAITTLLMMCVMPYLGIMKSSNVWAKFISPVFFFVMATFALTAVLAKTNIPNRIACFLVNWAGESWFKLILGYALGTAFLSSVMSNVPTCAMFMSLALALIKANGDPTPGTSNLGKALMIAIPMGSVLGGFSTPAGTSINILALYMFQDATGIRVTFLDWMVIGIPIALIGVFTVAAWISFVFKPEPIRPEAREAMKKMVADLGPLAKEEKKVLSIVVLMFVFWISSTWFPIVDATIVAVCGMIIFFIPGINLLTWKEYVDNCSWEALIMIGGIQSVAAGLVATGAANWLVMTTMSGAAEWNAMVTTGVASATAAVLHVIVPTGPAIIGIALLPLLEVAKLASLSPVPFMLITAFWSGVHLLLPIDTVPLITFSTGYYKFTDMVRAGWLPMLVMVVMTTLLIPIMAGWLGY